MSKASRIKAFLNIESQNNVLRVKSTTDLFQKLLTNVKNEYKKFHENRQPKINNLEVSPIISNKLSEGINTGYLEDQDFINSFKAFKEIHELPFSISQELKCDNEEKIQSEKSCQNQDIILFPSHHILKTSYFINKSFNSEIFHQVQRQHKIWWMKYGASPGKYLISDQKSDSFFKFVNIQSNVEDFSIDVETLKLFSLKDCIKDKTILNSYLSRIPNRKREMIPDVIETTIDLQVAAVALLFDAVNLSDDYTALHRRSSPYQLALITNGSSTRDLLDLARYIELLIQETDPNIMILNESNSEIRNQEELLGRFEMYDKIGLPYAIIIDDETLESGLFKLRNRNTTLSETIHLSDVTGYLIKIFNS